LHLAALPGTPRGQSAVAGQKQGTAPTGELHQGLIATHQYARTANAGRDQQRIREGAKGHDGQHVFTQNALAQHVGIL